MSMLTIPKVIQDLPATDNRRDFWLQIMSEIERNKFGLVCSKIVAHGDDVDYDAQCRIVVLEIARQFYSERKVKHEDGSITDYLK